MKKPTKLKRLHSAAIDHDPDDSLYSLESGSEQRRQKRSPPAPVGPPTNALFKTEPPKHNIFDKEEDDDQWENIGSRAITLDCSFVNVNSTALANKLTMSKSLKKALIDDTLA